MKHSQSTLDALADAETLRLALPRYGQHAEAAAWGGAAIKESAPDATGWTYLEPEDAAARCTVNAARAAFRAVPGLRGE